MSGVAVASQVSPISNVHSEIEVKPTEPNQTNTEQTDKKPNDEAPSTPPESSGQSPSSSVDESDPKLKLHRRLVPHIQVHPGTTICQNCFTTTTPLWRRDDNGQIMCNACGLFLKLHGRRRPISLKTDVIKSRNRGNRANRLEKQQTANRTKNTKTTNQQQVVFQTAQTTNLAIRQAQQAQQEAEQQAQRQARLQYRQANMHPPPPPNPPSLGPILPHPLSGMPPNFYPFSSPVLAAQSSHINKDPRMLSALAPLGQPLSPQIIAQTSGGSFVTGRMPTRGTMSELLLPCSPDLTDRIPHLAQIPVSQFQQQHSGSPPPKHPTAPAVPEDKQSASKDQLLTKVSELELVNDLLRRRVADLEASELRAKQEVEELKSQLKRHIPTEDGVKKMKVE